LQKSLAALPEEQRSVLLLVTVEELSYAQTAQVLGIPLGTVMSRLSRARERLMKMMEGENIIPLHSTLRRLK
jgi:RNA polymerase sigma-70 factor (ECF subfamily)